MKKTLTQHAALDAMLRQKLRDYTRVIGCALLGRPHSHPDLIEALAKLPSLTQQIDQRLEQKGRNHD